MGAKDYKGSGSSSQRRSARRQQSTNPQKPQSFKPESQVVLPKANVKEPDKTKQPRATKQQETLQQKLWYLSENNLFWGGGGAIIVTAYGFLILNVSAIFSGILFIAGGLFITASIYRRNFFEGKAKMFQLLCNSCIAIAITTILALSWILLQPKPVEHLFSLVPGNSLNPSSNCSIPPDAMAIYLGNSVYWTTKSSFNVIRLKNETLLSVEKAFDGIYLNAILRDKKGVEVARIVRNIFSAYDNSEYVVQSRDMNTIEIFDKKKGEPVLLVRYLNPNAIKILGTF
ncbi:MAG: hypothetical protein H0W77_05235 [Acidobacteria bacterium]|nr:hypothetical protein [Acidobacteriota bacterium]